MSQFPDYPDRESPRRGEFVDPATFPKAYPVVTTMAVRRVHPIRKILRALRTLLCLAAIVAASAIAATHLRWNMPSLMTPSPPQWWTGTWTTKTSQSATNNRSREDKSYRLTLLDNSTGELVIYDGATGSGAAVRVDETRGEQALLAVHGWGNQHLLVLREDGSAFLYRLNSVYLGHYQLAPLTEKQNQAREALYPNELTQHTLVATLYRPGNLRNRE